MTNVCHVHGDKFAACEGLPHPSRTLYCDGQGSWPVGTWTHQQYGECQRCGKLIRLRADGTIRAHNGKGQS